VVEERGTAAGDPVAQGWLAKRRLMGVLAVLGFAVPVIAYFWLIHRYSLNVILWDSWSDVKIIGDLDSGTLSFGNLWALHNENRILFPNLIVLLLGKTTHFNIVVEEYLGGVLLVGSIGLLVLTHRRRGGSIPWALYCPVAFLMLSFVQYQNTIWGFQMAWYLVLLMVMITIAILDRPTLTWWWMVLAIAAAVVASFSSLQGLIIWPVGLLLMYYRCRPRATIICWVGAGVVTTVLYFIHDNSSGNVGYLVHHPIAGAEFYFISIGDVVGATVSGVKGAGIVVLLLGVVIFLTSIWALVTYCWGRDETSGSPIAACLICFGLLFAAVVTEGRLAEGMWVAGSSRYRTFNLLIVVGLYLVLIEQFALRRHNAMRGREGTGSARADPARSVGGASTPHNAVLRAFPLFAVVVVSIVCAQVAIGIPNGLAGARSIHDDDLQAARVVVNINRYSDGFVYGTLGAGESSIFIRKMATIAQKDHLSLFATAAAAQYKAEGLLKGGPPVTAISVPASGAVLKGAAIISATATSIFRVTKVEFTATGPGLDNVVIGTGAAYRFGWFIGWRTSSLRNGSYILRSVVYGASGRHTSSPAVPVVIENG
jgi:hypothetical protein